MNAVSLVIYPASDVPKAKEFFTGLLGTDPYADSPYYVGFKTGSVEIGITQKNPQSAGALVYVDVADIKSALDSVLAAGAEKVQDITDVAQGLLVASFKDPDGNTIGLRQFPKG